MKTGWIQYAESYKGECDNQALGPRRAKEVSDNVGALLPWCFCNFVMPLIFDLLSLLYQSIFFFSFFGLYLLMRMAKSFIAQLAPSIVSNRDIQGSNPLSLIVL